MKTLYKILAIAMVAVFLGGGSCATTTGATIEQKVAIPVPCKATVPVRPAMPTDSVAIEPKTTFMDRFTAAATAEIEIREPYEGLLLKELQSCL